MSAAETGCARASTCRLKAPAAPGAPGGWRGFLRGLRSWKIDHFADHSIHQYIDAILKAVQQEDQLIKSGGEVKPASAYANTED